MARVIVCDVNETLLDLGALAPHFKQAFGDGRVWQDWFGTVLLYSEVATLAGPYSDFSSIGRAALDMTATSRGVVLSASDRAQILQSLLTLPAQPDVRDGLQAMRDAGLRLVTLTNSAPAAVQQQLANAGLAPFFEHSFSVDTVKRFKPAAEAYARWRSRLGFPWIDCVWSRRMRGTSLARFARDAPPHSWPGQERFCTRSVLSRILQGRTSAASPN